jgi:predicted O-methyltransferase YrrM
LKQEEQRKFKKSDLDLDSGLVLLNGILNKKLGRYFDFKNDSIHWLVFSALSARGYKPERILEIGTFDGEFTFILSQLFPESEVVTVDLPESDPLLRGLYDRENDEAFTEYLRIQRTNLSQPNIQAIKCNSFFILDQFQCKFDLIWVDGGHLYPEVAWDLCSSYHLCSPGGYVLCDDVIPESKSYKDQYVSHESNEVLEYVQSRVDCELTLFLKRRNPELYARRHTRKYVSCMRKPIPLNI